MTNKVFLYYLFLEKYKEAFSVHDEIGICTHAEMKLGMKEKDISFC